MFCLIDYNCIIVLLKIAVFVCHDKGNVFLHNKFTSICIAETTKYEIKQYFIRSFHIKLQFLP